MGAASQRRKPAYAITSVDNALRLIQMLRDIGEVRGKDAAEVLNISPSSAHRLMSMLVYRGFAVQNDSRAYLPGPAVGVAPAVGQGAKELQEIVRPHLARLQSLTGESAYFMVLTGRVIRFLLTAESSYPTHAGDRHGFVIPAHSSAGGRAILSSIPPSEMEDIYAAPEEQEGVSLDSVELDRLHVVLRAVRSRGYAISVEEVERGIVSVAASIRNSSLQPRAAISISGPLMHRRTLTDSASIASLLEAREAIESQLLEINGLAN